MKTLPDLPRHRAIIAVDMEASTARTNTAKIRLRGAMYELLEAALCASGITQRNRDPLIDRGDGILVLVRPVDQAPKTLLLKSVIPRLNELLVDHGAQHPDQQLRLRAVVHAGEVHYDQRGCFGEALDLTFRLLDAPDVKKMLRQTAVPLALVVSDDIYLSVVRHGYDGIECAAYRPLVHVQIGGRRHRGWIHVPDAGLLCPRR